MWLLSNEQMGKTRRHSCNRRGGRDVSVVIRPRFD